MSWEIDFFGDEQVSVNEYISRKTIVKQNKIISKSVNDFSQVIDVDLMPGIQYRFITTKAFNAITVIDYLIKSNEIDEITIAIYRVNLLAVRKIEEYLDSGVKVNILVSNFFRENKKYETWAKYLTSLSTKNNARVAFAQNHAKICLIKTSNKHIVFEGSGNLSDNNRIEQYLLENNKNIYDFHFEWILTEIEKKANA